MAVKWNDKAIFAAIERGARAGLEIAGEIVASEAISKVKSPPKTGRFYERYKPTRIVQASAPGEAPANDTGNLAANIGPKPGIVSDGGALVKKIESKAEYSDLLERGGFGAGGPYTEVFPETGRKVYRSSTNPYIAPRPFLRPSLFENEKEIVSAISKEIKKALKG